MVKLTQFSQFTPRIPRIMNLKEITTKLDVEEKLKKTQSIKNSFSLKVKERRTKMYILCHFDAYT